MHIIGGTGNWKLKTEPRGDGIAIRKAATPDADAAIPERILGQTVVGLEKHALSPGIWEEEADDIVITASSTAFDQMNGAAVRSISEEYILSERGPGAEADARTMLRDKRVAREARDWTNEHLRSLMLPGSIEYVGDYALHNLRALGTLGISDTVSSWGRGVTAGCRNLRRIVVECRTGDVEHHPVPYIVHETMSEIEAVIHSGDETTRLIFPDYGEEFVETPFSQSEYLQYSIMGAGYPYHQSFSRGHLRIREYDELWPKYLTMGYDVRTAVRLAFLRLRYPTKLEGKARRRYEDFIRLHAGEAIIFAAGENDPAGTSLILGISDPDREALAEGLDIAGRRGATEVKAVLLNALHERFPAAREKKYIL